LVNKKMRNLEQPPIEQTPEEVSKPEKEYNFELMEKTEPVMVSLVTQLKDGIEQGRWSSLLSDDIGGRIPTLVLRRILKEKGPNPNVRAHFLAAGQRYMPSDRVDLEEYEEEGIIADFNNERRPPPAASEEEKKKYEKVKDYLRKLDFGDERILIVTQYVFRGKTLEKMGFALGDAEVKNPFDFAIVHTSGLSGSLRRIEAFKHLVGSEIFIGAEEYSSHLASGHETMAGFAKKENYSPRPETLVGHIRKGGRKQLLTLQEAKEIQKNMRLAREDVKTMAKRVIEQVWK